ncbi:unnamed protein product [Sympodiomycopsis kandeliae]
MHAHPASLASALRHATEQLLQTNTNHNCFLHSSFSKFSPGSQQLSSMAHAAATAVAAPTEDPFGGRAFISPAKIRILLTPAGPDVSPREFEQWAAYVRQFESIALTDLPTSQTGRAGPAPGSPLHRYGEVHLSFVTSYDPSHAFLAPFAMHRQILGVLGLGSFKSNSDRMAMERAPSALRELHPNAIVHRAYIFDTVAGDEKRQASYNSSPASSTRHSRQSSRSEAERNSQDETGRRTPVSASGAADDNSSSTAEESFTPASASQAAGFADRGNSGLVIFPAIRSDGKDVRFYLRTLIREFVGSLLDGLDSIVKGLEGKPLETPRETLDGFASSGSSSSGNANTSSQSSSSSSSAASPSSSSSSAASRASSFFSSFGSSSTSSTSSSSTGIGGGQQPSILSAGNNSGDASSKSTVSRSSASASAKGSPKRASSLVGAGPTGSGRYAKVKADYSLLCGDLWGAITGYDACLNWLGKERALAGGQDAVWYASALEHWAVTRCLIFRMSGLEEKGPSLNLPTGGVKEKDKKEKETLDLPFARFEWGEVAEAYALALQIYGKTLAPPRYLLESARSVNSDTPRDYTHPLIHASACMAYSRLLLSVWASSGWNAECFDQLIYGGVPPALVEDARPGPAMYASLSKASGVQRHEIAAPASLGLSHSVAALKPPDQIHILCSLANIYGCIGFPRREAYLLRQLQAAVVSLLARALILHPREPVTISSALKQIAGSDHTVLGTLVSQTLTSGLGEGADAVLILALQICETYGINVDVDPLKNLPPHHILSKAAQTGKKTATGEPLLKKKSRASWGAQAGASQAGGEDGDLSIVQEEAAFGWADLQIALLKDTICVAEMLQDHVGMAFFAAILVRDYHELLSAGEQQSLIRGLNACVRTARMQDAGDLEVLYWGPAEPLCSVETIPLLASRRVVERPAKDLIAADEAGKGNQSTGLQNTPAGTQNPFFWNPSSSISVGSKQSVLVEDELARFYVTLQNPFKTPLELSSLRLSTTGADFEADTIEVSLPPTAFRTISLTGTPRKSGVVNVRGIFLTLQGCKEREFKVSLHEEANEKQRQAREAVLDDRRSRLKTQGLDARPAVLAQRRAAQAAAEGETGKAGGKKALHHIAGSSNGEKFVACKVGPSQPMLTIDSPSLSHGQLLLYDGEERTLKIRLTNPTSLPVDFAEMTTTDDLSEAIRASLTEGDLLPSDVHQLEYQLLHSPVFSDVPRRPRSIRIPPHGRSITIPIKVRGKLDCTRGCINVDFGHVNAPGRGGLPTEETKNFYTRRVSLVFGIAVVPLLECGALGIREIGRAEAESLTQSIQEEYSRRPGNSTRRVGITSAIEDKAVTTNVNGDHPPLEDGKHSNRSSSATACLMTLDVRNMLDNAVEAVLKLQGDTHIPNSEGSALPRTNVDDSRTLSISRAISPGHTSSFALPISKFDLPLELLNSPIPSLSSRQFIVSKMKTSPEEEALIRRRFWYRQSLLSRLSGTWTDLRTGQSGRIALEEQDVTDRMVLQLRLDPLEVNLELQGDSPSKSLVREETSDAVITSSQAESFHRIVSQITNYTDRPVKLLYRLVPLPSSAIDAWSGIGLSSTSNESNPQRNSNSAPGSGPNQPLQASGTHSNDPTLSQLLITDGSLVSPITPWPLSPGETTSMSTGIVFLAKGRFAFTACVEEALQLDDEEQEERGGTKERLVCVARRSLIVDC